MELRKVFFVILLLGGLLAGCPRCDEVPLHRVVNASGASAASYARSCGSASGIIVRISRGAPEQVGKEVFRTLLPLGEDAAAPHLAGIVKLEWRASDQLAIVYSSRLEPSERIAEAAGVTVTFEASDSLNPVRPQQPEASAKP